MIGQHTKTILTDGMNKVQYKGISCIVQKNTLKAELVKADQVAAQLREKINAEELNLDSWIENYCDLWLMTDRSEEPTYEYLVRLFSNGEDIAYVSDENKVFARFVKNELHNRAYPDTDKEAVK